MTLSQRVWRNLETADQSEFTTQASIEDETYHNIAGDPSHDESFYYRHLQQEQNVELECQHNVNGCHESPVEEQSNNFASIAIGILICLVAIICLGCICFACCPDFAGLV